MREWLQTDEDRGPGGRGGTAGMATGGKGRPGGAPVGGVVRGPREESPGQLGLQR